MKLFLILCIVQLTIIQNGHGLKPIDLCQLEEKKCEGYYDSSYNFKTRCESVQCDSFRKYYCGLDYCSTNKITCDEFLNVKFVLKAMSRLNAEDLRVRKYTGFVKTIKSCPTSVHVWQPTEMCLNGVNCYSKTSLSLRYDNVNVIKKIDCVCTGDFSVQCGKDYCSASKSACSAFKPNEIGNLNEIKSCNNSHTYFDDM